MRTFLTLLLRLFGILVLLLGGSITLGSLGSDFDRSTEVFAVMFALFGALIALAGGGIIALGFTLARRPAKG